ncbi:hypothetical protein ACFFJN_08780 [Erwinia mallotivora]|uniref:hypothetical protein n=1 Tax=Erwinia mallotivora TaxID=69222 RepID=UPI0035EEA500
MNYMKASSAHTVEETQSMIVIVRKKKTRCADFNHVVEAVLADHPDAKRECSEFCVTLNRLQRHHLI